MKAKIALISGAAAGCMALAGCGGNSHTASSPVAPPASSTTFLDTAAVLTIVNTKTSDSTLPFEVNGGAYAFTPVDDSQSATVVDGT
ncbi:MAG TPA: hypothetical protein VGH84_14070 [Steroidobacteraceae bacterium]|jgi:hypothetical protein